MSNNTETFITRDWDDIAIDDGSFLNDQGDYLARLTDRSSNQYTSEVDRISYSPSVNSAPSITIDIEPRSEFEGTDFLGGDLEVFVNGDVLFAGGIVKFDFSQKEGDWYSVKAESPGRQLADEIIDENVQDEVTMDYILKKIDKYNSFDDDHKNLAGTADESLTSVIKLGNDVRKGDTGGGTATYSSVGSDASAIQAIYYKVKNSGSIKINTNNSSYSENFSGHSAQYGEWVKLTPDSSLNAESYDLEISLDEGSYLYDWISLTEQKLQRDSTPFNSEVIETGKTIEDISSDSDWNNVVSFASEKPAQINNGTLELNQTLLLSGDSELSGDAYTRTSSFDYQTATDGQYEALLARQDTYGTRDSFGYKLSVDDVSVGVRTGLEDGALSNEGDAQYLNILLDGPGIESSTARWLNSPVTPDSNEVSVRTQSIDTGTVQLRDDSGLLLDSVNADSGTFQATDSVGGDTVYKAALKDAGQEFDDETIYVNSGPNGGGDTTENTTVDAEVEVSSVLLSTIDNNQSSERWYWHNSSVDTLELPNYLNAGDSYRVGARIDDNMASTFSDDPGVKVDVVTLYEDTYNYTFDNSVHTTEGYLDSPSLYPQNVYVSPDNVLASNNIEGATVSIDANKVTSDTSIQMKFDENSAWVPSDGSEDNTTSVSESVEFPTRYVEPRFGMSGVGSTRDTATPRKEYNSQQINSYTIDVDVNDFGVIVNQDFSDNRLSVISSLADDSIVLYRWEGNQCKVFKEGDEVSNVDLKEEKVTSSVDVEDTYASVEVIGSGGVTSGVVNAQDAPSYVTSHREIRDRDIDTVDDANRRARSFLANNSSVSYSGSVTTLPTRVPVGEEIGSSIFNHGEDGVIQDASYSKNRTNFSVGKEKSLAYQILNLKRDERSSQVSDTS